MSNGKKILFCNNILWDLINFRGYVIRRLVDEGFDVLVVAPQEENPGMKVSIPAGVRYIPVRLDRCGRSPLDDMAYFFALYKIYRKERPDYIFHYTIKPNIYGTFAAKLLNIPCTDMVAGLGYALLGDGMMHKIASLLYKMSVRNADHLFVLNKENYNFILKERFSSADKIVWLKGGEGVDLKCYPFTDNDADETVFIMISRLLKDKGYCEFVKAAKIVREKYPTVRFQLLGPLDNSNPAHVTRKELEADIASGAIEYLGVTENVPEIVSRPGTVVVLPSYHEGLSRSLMEACAMGKPIITTDIPGCRETVKEGVNGFLVEVKNAEALAGAMFRYLSLTRDQKKTFSQAGRALAERVFDIEIVVSEYKNILEQQGIL